MSSGYQALTEKEKETLRLIVRGHDAKSTAQHLGLSVHTINERLRDARRKLEVSSSREAARLVLATESATPESLTDKELREALAIEAVARPAMPESGINHDRRGRRIFAGVIIMSFLLGMLALTALPQQSVEPPAPPQASIVLAQPAKPVRCTVVDDRRAPSKLGKSRGASGTKTSNVEPNAARAADALSRMKAPLRLRCDQLPS